MVKSQEEVAENRYREDYGRFYEEFEVGDVYEHRPARTVTKDDNIQYTLLTHNTHPLHFNDEYGKQTEFGECLVNSGLTLSIISGMSVSDVSNKTIANLGWTDIVLPNPVFAGDTLYSESEVLKKRESESRPGDGIVTVETRGYKQNGEKVIQYERTMLIPKEEKGDPIDPFPEKQEE